MPFSRFPKFTEGLRILLVFLGVLGSLRCTYWGMGRMPTLLSTTLNYSSLFLAACVLTYVTFALAGVLYYRSKWAAGSLLAAALIMRVYTEWTAPAWPHIVRAIEFHAWLDPPLLLAFYALTLGLPAWLLLVRLRSPRR